MRRVVLAVLLAAPSVVAAQATTADLLRRGKSAYENFQVDAARSIFQQILSPSYLNKVEADERVTALKYLGASYAVLGQPDSAQIFFVAALDFDPFTDLGNEFSASELGPFLSAKQRVFHVGIRKLDPAVVNPRVDSTFYRFQLVTTHSANLRLELVKLGTGSDSLKEILFDGPAQGLREVRWDGLLRSAGGRLADSANYLLRLTGTSTLRRSANEGAFAPETRTQFLKIEHAFEPLEDTLPVLDPATMKLQDKVDKSAPWFDLAKGVGFGLAAYGVGALVLSPRYVSFQGHAIGAALVAIGSGTASWLYRSKNREIPEAQVENARRERQRADFNAAVRARNLARIARTQLVITEITASR